MRRAGLARAGPRLQKHSESLHDARGNLHEARAGVCRAAACPPRRSSAGAAQETPACGVPALGKAYRLINLAQKEDRGPGVLT
jgi:hypothetical protein